MKKVLVAGSTGYLGKFIIMELNKKGYWIRALARNPDKLSEVKGLVDEILIGEITKPESIVD